MYVPIRETQAGHLILRGDRRIVLGIFSSLGLGSLITSIGAGGHTERSDLDGRTAKKHTW